MVGWGGLPNFTEFDSKGQIVYDAQLPTGENSYRVYRVPWAGQPTELPRLVVKSPQAYASWNGATTVSFWEVLGGSSPRHLKPVARRPSAGFETSLPVPAGRFFQARALSASGRLLASSHVVRPRR
jgi:hypothetical protein